jgi:release factor glutamine methyltransferase
VTVLEVIRRSAEYLARKGVDSPRLQIELLLAHVLHLPRLQLYLNFERRLNDPELTQVRELVRRRANREPLQHLTGSAAFCGFDLAVSPEVLIPRPETEVLAERAWNLLRDSREVAPSALDYGTGSGCLAIALARHCPAARITALEISESALALARTNGARQGVADRIDWVRGDGFSALSPGTLFDLIVANPPYVPSAEIAGLAPEVRDYDPLPALDGGPDGLNVIRRLAIEAGAFLRPSGHLVLEFGDGQAARVADLFAGRGWVAEAVEPDLSGRARIFVARPGGK